MINTKLAQKYCCEDISLIENYDEALRDMSQTWDIHHKRENTTPARKLIEDGEYYHRPATELVFLTHSDHCALHMSEKRRGKPAWNSGTVGVCKAWNKGKVGVYSKESLEKMSKAHKGQISSMKGRHHTPESRVKCGLASIGMHWWNNGETTAYAKECPPGYVKGRLPLKRKKKQ